MNEEISFSWTANSTHMCYESENNVMCGLKGNCSQKGMLLPLVFEEAWSKEFRVFLYLFGLLYRSKRVKHSWLRTPARTNVNKQTVALESSK